MTTPKPPAIAALDVPLADVETFVRLKRLAAGREAEQRHQLDTADTAFARMACEHPDKCACDSDYPEWAAALAARTAAKPGRAN